MIDYPVQMEFDFSCEESDFIADSLELKAQKQEDLEEDTDLLEWYHKIEEEKGEGLC